MDVFTQKILTIKELKEEIIKLGGIQSLPKNGTGLHGNVIKQDLVEIYENLLKIKQKTTSKIETLLKNIESLTLGTKKVSPKRVPEKVSPKGIIPHKKGLPERKRLPSKEKLPLSVEETPQLIVNSNLPPKLKKYGPEIKILGEGSYGQVTLHESTDGELYAIKTLDFVMGSELGAAEIESTSVIELAIFKRMNHPNILKLIDYGITNDLKSLKLVSEYMQKGNLRSYFKTIPPIKRSQVARSLVYRLLCGMSYIHSLNIIHCDIKPENILVGENNTLKIGDFGIASALTCVRPENKSTKVVTRWYRPPELLYGGRGDQYDISLDMWSCGCVIYEILTNMILFKGENDRDMRRFINVRLGDPTILWPGITTFPRYIEDKKNNLIILDYKGELKEIKEDLLYELKDEKEAQIWFELIIGMVKYDPTKRLTAIEALKNNFFNPIRNEKLETKKQSCLHNLYLVEKPINFTIDQTIINKRMKNLLIDWMLNFSIKFRLNIRTYYIALYLHDSLNWANFSLTKENYRLFGIGCLYLAGTYNEIHSPYTPDFEYFSGKAYTNKQIIDMSTKILENIDFKLVFSTCYDFNIEYGKVYDYKIQKLSQGLLFFLSLLPEKLYQTKPDQVALMSIMMACMYYETRFIYMDKVDNNLIKNLKFCLDLIIEDFGFVENLFKNEKYNYSPKPGMGIREVLKELCNKKLIT